jgi:hypothetical protein
MNPFCNSLRQSIVHTSRNSEVKSNGRGDARTATQTTGRGIRTDAVYRRRHMTSAIGHRLASRWIRGGPTTRYDQCFRRHHGCAPGTGASGAGFVVARSSPRAPHSTPSASRSNRPANYSLPTASRSTLSALHGGGWKRNVRMTHLGKSTHNSETFIYISN